MARPSLGTRKQVLVRLPMSLIAQIDSARGPMAMNAWLERAARHALTPISQFSEPVLLQPQHEHTLVPSRTEFEQGVKVRFSKCIDCDMEVRT